MAGKTKFGRFLGSRGSNQTEAAGLLGISVTAMSMKARGETNFKLDELRKLKAHYNMTGQEVLDVFFG